MCFLRCGGSFCGSATNALMHPTAEMYKNGEAANFPNGAHVQGDNSTNPDFVPANSTDVTTGTPTTSAAATTTANSTTTASPEGGTAQKTSGASSVGLAFAVASTLGLVM